ncbi:MAG: hypothetical protein GY714_21045 [Desulfobacterales bacterium]|nr:hypothetical protein [Desulfobacterales bacterium]
MGKIKQGIFGGVSGKIGNLVGASWKGINYLRTMPLSVANPNTAAQQTQRSKFGHAVALSKIILVSVIKPLLDRFASQESGFNVWIRNNLKNFDIEGVIDNPHFVNSAGKVTGFLNAGFNYPPDTYQLEITYQNNTGVGDALASDEVYGFCYNSVQKTVGLLVSHATRENTQCFFQFDEIIAPGQDIYVFLSYRRADGTSVSNTESLLAV